MLAECCAEQFARLLGEGREEDAFAAIEMAGLLLELAEGMTL